MKKNILKFALVATIALAAGWNISQDERELKLSDVASVNIEALASGEGGSPCGGPKTYGDCQSINSVNCKDLSGCQ